jgi:hypothetical protein
MLRGNYASLLKADWLKLVPILGLAFYVSFIPHLNYPYPVHFDEWVWMAFTKALTAAHSTTFREPFSGAYTLTFSSNLEAGFQLFLSFIQQITAISWTTLFRYFPAVISVFTVLSVYVLGKRQGFGWEAALLTALIPTSVGILGPAFLVPVSLGLLFIPLSLFVAFHFKTWPAYLILFLFTTFLLAMHAPSAICLVILLVPYVLLNLKGNFKHSAGIFLALILPFLIVFPWIFDLLLPTAKSLLQPSPQAFQYLNSVVTLPQIITRYGYLPGALCLVGVFSLYLKGGKEKLGLALALLALLVMLAAFFTFHYGVAIVYVRGLLFALLMIGIVAGAGLMAVKDLKLNARTAGFSVPRPLRHLGYPVCLVVIVVTLVIAIPARQNTAYYQMIDQKDYQAFNWIQANIPAGYAKAILDPWKATAFTALTGKNVYTRIGEIVQTADQTASAFLDNGCSDTSFLKDNGISLVYTRQSVANPDLVEVRQGVYLLKK